MSFTRRAAPEQFPENGCSEVAKESLEHACRKLRKENAELLAELAPHRERAETEKERLATEKATRTVRIVLTSGQDAHVETASPEEAAAALARFNLAKGIFAFGPYVLRVDDIARLESPPQSAFTDWKKAYRDLSKSFSHGIGRW